MKKKQTASFFRCLLLKLLRVPHEEKKKQKDHKLLYKKESIESKMQGGERKKDLLALSCFMFKCIAMVSLTVLKPSYGSGIHDTVLVQNITKRAPDECIQTCLFMASALH